MRARTSGARTIGCLRHIRTALVVVGGLLAGCDAQARERWSADQAHAWYRQQPWLVGCNYIPSTAINQLEMWQADTFDPKAIDRELGWAAGLGFTSARVFLHDLLWQQDRDGFLRRMEQFLAIADKHKIGVLFVLFDSVWDPFPRPGKQRGPKRSKETRTDQPNCPIGPRPFGRSP